MHYELYYWPGLQGRGEFVRLALEDAGAGYTDMAREGGSKVIQSFVDGEHDSALPFAPPFLKAGRQVVAQTACILHYLGPALGLVPNSEPRRLQALQLQMTIADLVAEVHDSHHPIAGGLYYDEQKSEALRRSKDLRSNRLPKFLGHFEQVLERSGGLHPLREHSYVDLSLFQLISGLEYAFPNAMRRLSANYPKLMALKQRVAERPKIAAYLASERRVAFNTDGIFRHYPELDES